MDFTLSDEQQMFLDMFRDFAGKEVAPLAEELDRQERPPLETLEKAAGLDLLGIPFPEQYGGMNAGVLPYGLLIAELARACLSTALTVAAHCDVGMLIAAGGTAAQKERFLPALARGESIGASAVAEPDAGSDLQAIATTALLDGDYYVLNGRKSYVLNGDFARLTVVVAQTEQGLAAFVIEKGTPGLTIGWRNRQMGLRGASSCNIFLDDCRVSPANRLGGASGDAAQLIAGVWPFARLGVAFACVGIAERGLADSVEFARNRQQFGGPIALKQTIQCYLADMATQIESLRYMAYHTAWLMEQDKATERDIAMLKLWAGQVSTWVINKTVQIHGGMGYIKSFHVERLYRDVRALTIYEGTTETQRVAVASAILRSAGVEISL
jgi:butyryl-CoA dehydrogenase